LTGDLTIGTWSLDSHESCLPDTRRCSLQIQFHFNAQYHVSSSTYVSFRSCDTCTGKTTYNGVFWQIQYTETLIQTCVLLTEPPSLVTRCLGTCDSSASLEVAAVEPYELWKRHVNPFKPGGVKWLHFKVFRAILV